MSLPMDYASVCCSYYIQICAITAQITDLEREEHDKKELYGGGGGRGQVAFELRSIRSLVTVKLRSSLIRVMVEIDSCHGRDRFGSRSRSN